MEPSIPIWTTPEIKSLKTWDDCMKIAGILRNAATNEPAWSFTSRSVKCILIFSPSQNLFALTTCKPTQVLK